MKISKTCKEKQLSDYYPSFLINYISNLHQDLEECYRNREEDKKVRFLRSKNSKIVGQWERTFFINLIGIFVLRKFQRRVKRNF